MTRLARGVADSLGPLAGVVGHSLGAAAAVLALRDGLDARAAVAIAPPRRMQPFLTGFTRALGLGAAHDDAIRRAIEARVGRPFGDFDVDRAARTLATPGLVLHDVGDRQVPFADGVEIAESWPMAALVALEGLGHRRVLHDADVARQVVGFLLEHAVPSTAPRTLGGATRPAADSTV
jgi:pimeloyl-ACP methyl ester carboxylesterase